MVSYAAYRKPLFRLLMKPSHQRLGHSRSCQMSLIQPLIDFLHWLLKLCKTMVGLAKCVTPINVMKNLHEREVGL
jgi:hypothetical protein